MSFTVKTTVEFSDEQINDFIDTANIEYWINDYETHADESFTITVEGDGAERDENWGSIFTINRKRMETGLQAMADKAPRHFADLVSENYDSGTCDVLIQFCCFGDIVYG